MKDSAKGLTRLDSTESWLAAGQQFTHLANVAAWA